MQDIRKRRSSELEDLVMEITSAKASRLHYCVAGIFMIRVLTQVKSVPAVHNPLSVPSLRLYGRRIHN